MKVLKISERPPSVNAMYTPVSRGRSVKSRAGRSWTSLALAELSSQVGIGDKPGYWSIAIKIPAIGAKCDLTNYEKALVDSIVAAKKAPDDRYIVKTSMEFYGGDCVIAEIQREPTELWATIKGASKALTKKLYGPNDLLA